MVRSPCPMTSQGQDHSLMMVLDELRTETVTVRECFCLDKTIRNLWNNVIFYPDEPIYGKCPNISYTKVSEKMAYANSVDPDQTAPEGAV